MNKVISLIVGILALSTGCGPYRPRPPEVVLTSIPLMTLGPTATFVPTLDRKPTPTLTPTPTATPIIYVVKKGDILGQIALDYNVSIEAIMMANGLKDAHLLSIGQKLLIPNESMLEEMARGGLSVLAFTPTAAFPTPTLYPGSIPWDEAEKHIGDRVEVEGLIVRLRKAGGEIYLYFHDPPEGYLSVRIPAEQVKHFAAQPEIYYLDHWVRVNGIIEEAGSGLQITVRERSQLSVLQ